MKRYAEFAPTGFDLKGAFLPDQQDWLVAPVGTNRDADTLTRSNWEVVSKDLDRIDPDRIDHQEYSFGHWGPGWFTIIIIRPGSPCEELAEEWEQALADYPVADDEHYSQMEVEEETDANQD